MMTDHPGSREQVPPSPPPVIAAGAGAAERVLALVCQVQELRAYGMLLHASNLELGSRLNAAEDRIHELREQVEQLRAQAALLGPFRRLAALAASATRRIPGLRKAARRALDLYPWRRGAGRQST